MVSVLIGHTGFIGSNLLTQIAFTHCYNRSNAADPVPSGVCDLVVCAGAPGVKWEANAEPVRDWNNIKALIALLERFQARRLVLISTADVFGQPVVGHEGEIPNPDCPYGVHRARLEQVVRDLPRSQIIRLPGVVGPGLRKGPIYDLENEHRLEHLNPDSVYQWYDVRNLWADVERNAGRRIAHLCPKPERLADTVAADFPRLVGRLTGTGTPARYNLRSIYGDNRL